MSRYLVFFALALGVCAADLASKRWMFAHLGMPGFRGPWWIWKGVFGFQTSLNEGALFGMGQGLWPLFAALSVAAAVGIFIWLFPAGAARNWLLTIALALVTAGILGNLYDRLGLPGFGWPAGDPVHLPGAPVHAVRDFISSDDRPLALAHLQPGRQLVGLRCRAAGLARLCLPATRGGGRGTRKWRSSNDRWEMTKHE